MVGRCSLLAALLVGLVGVSACVGAFSRAYDASVDALADRIEAEPRNGAFRAAVDAKAEGGGPEVAREIAARFDALGIVPLRVPGLYYASHPQSGAHLDDVELWLGRPVVRAPVDEVGTVEANAESSRRRSASSPPAAGGSRSCRRARAAPTCAKRSRPMPRARSTSRSGSIWWVSWKARRSPAHPARRLSMCPDR